MWGLYSVTVIFFGREHTLCPFAVCPTSSWHLPKLVLNYCTFFWEGTYPLPFCGLPPDHPGTSPNLYSITVIFFGREHTLCPFTVCPTSSWHLPKLVLNYCAFFREGTYPLPFCGLPHIIILDSSPNSRLHTLCKCIEALISMTWTPAGFFPGEIKW